MEKSMLFPEKVYLDFDDVSIPIEIKRYHNSNKIKLTSKGSKIIISTGYHVKNKRIIEAVQEWQIPIYELYHNGLAYEKEMLKQYQQGNFVIYLEGFRYYPKIIRNQKSGNKLSSYHKDNILYIKAFEQADYNAILAVVRKFRDYHANWLLTEYFKEFFDDFKLEEELRPKLVIRKMKTQWGNYKRKSNSITLNLHLAELPSKLINYVIYHEFMHAIEPNHSPEFYKLIDKRYLERKLFDAELKKWAFVLKDEFYEEYSDEKSR